MLYYLYERIKDSDIREIVKNYRSSFDTAFRNERKMSDRSFSEYADDLEKETDNKIFGILDLKNKKIFDIILEDEIVVTYSEEQLMDLYHILKGNKIKCGFDDFVSYSWVKVNKNVANQFGNGDPINLNCKVYNFEEFFSIINI